MKRTLLIVFFVLCCVMMRAQAPALWFTPNQQYYKFPVVADGWYRIPYSTLVTLYGASLSSIPSGQFALYHNGTQVCMFSSAAPGNALGNQDYFSFYGQHNIGDLDTVLYKSAWLQPHPYYSLFTDTSYYYLTVVSTNISVLRFSNVSFNLSNPPAAEQYFIYPSRQFFTVQNGQNLQGKGQYLSGEEVWSSVFDTAEGYADINFIGVFPEPSTGQVQSKTYTLSTPNAYQGSNAPQSQLYAVFANYSPVGQNLVPDQHQLTYNVNSSTVYNQPTGQSGFQLNKITAPFATSAITSASTNVTVASQSVAATSFQQNAIYLNEIDYPRSYNFQGLNSFHFQLTAGNAIRYLPLANFSSNGSQPTLFDLTRNEMYQSIQPVGSDTIKFVIGNDNSNYTGPHDLYVLSNDPSSYATVNSMSPVVFQDYSSLLSNCDYAIITDSSLMVDVDGNGIDEITDYAHHRDANYNPQTGKYHPEVFTMSQLYDEFAYGVKKSPLAIRNFIQYALAKYHKLKFCFLMGKGIEYNYTRSGGGLAYAQCLVPSWGQPASDHLLAATRTNYAPQVAVGRLAALNAQQVYAYRRKMTVYDSLQTYNVFTSNCVDIPDKLWQKQILHFSGGSDYTEQIIFQQYLHNYGDTAAGLFWGANVTAYAKTSSQPISQTEAAIIQAQIDSGVSLVSFFGHSSTGGFDFSINEPENYTNYNKYPVLLSDGCFSGDIFDTVTSPTNASYSERFVLEGGIGTIAFMATSGLSVSDGLDLISSSLYDTFCKPEYYNALGISVQKMEDNIFSNPAYANAYNDSVGTYLGAFEMTLHGDPGLWLNQYPKPDFALAQHSGASVYFTPSVITPGLDSFKLNVIVTNLGKAINKTIAVSVQRTITPIGGATVVLPVTKKYIPAPYYIDTISFTFPVQVGAASAGQGTIGTGANQFAVMLDADDSVNEMTKCNNGYTISINIQSDDLEPIYPYEFAIDSDVNVVLKASTTNPFAPLRKYDFQFDTSRAFNSPFLQTYSVTQVGGVLHWNHPTLLNKDSTVYYWRVKIDTSNTWHYSSFVHIPGMYGWQQSHFWQFTQDNYLLLKLDTVPRKFQFDSTLNNITVCTGYTTAVYQPPVGKVNFEEMGWNYNNVPMYRYRMGGCGFIGGLTFAVIDGTTGLPWISYNNDGDNWGDTYGNYMCSDQLYFQYGFDFSTTGTHLGSAAQYANHSWSSGNTTWSVCIQNFINSIPNGDYVLVYADNMVPYTSWDDTLVTALSGLGILAPLYKSGAYTGPFIYFTKKGVTGYPYTYVPTVNGYDSISASINFMGNWYQGQMTSPLIGPAVKWSKMQWGRPSTENPKVYKDSVDIIGISNTGAPTVLRTTGLYDLSLQNISPLQYPMMQLRFRTLDDSLRLASQLQYWRVIYQKPAELAINPAAYFSLTNTQSVGGSVKLAIGLENVTKIRMDSVLVKYSLTNAANANSSTEIRYGPMPGIDTLILNYNLAINNSAFQGTNQLALEVNPSGDHIEQFHFNNYANVSFTAAGDSLNPLLDVTFDGQHIFNGDIVSAKPDILVTLHDNSKYLPLSDTSAISLYLLAPNSTQPVHINYDNQILKFYPADSSNIAKVNRCQAEFKPTLPIDGSYELLVRDEDRSGNHSSTNANRVEDNTYYDYKIDFQVINKPMISNVLNYPNPFSTSTRFIFTVTGSEVPDYMRIRIMTVRGTVVKEITKDEMGPLHVGTNITEYAWDGRDQYGSELANGVYFYQVVTKENNDQMTHMSESYDQYFKKGIGKLVILR